MIWSFARDRGLPLWWIWSKVDKRTRTPLFTVWLAATIAFLLGLPVLKSAVAFSGVVSISVVGLCVPRPCAAAMNST